MDAMDEMELVLLNEQVEDERADRAIMERALDQCKTYLDMVPVVLRGQCWADVYDAVCDALGIE